MSEPDLIQNLQFKVGIALDDWKRSSGGDSKEINLTRLQGRQRQSADRQIIVPDDSIDLDDLPAGQSVGRLLAGYVFFIAVVGEARARLGKSVIELERPRSDIRGHLLRWGKIRVLLAHDE